MSPIPLPTLPSRIIKSGISKNEDIYASILEFVKTHNLPMKSLENQEFRNHVGKMMNKRSKKQNRSTDFSSESTPSPSSYPSPSSSPTSPASYSSAVSSPYSFSSDSSPYSTPVNLSPLKLPAIQSLEISPTSVARSLEVCLLPAQQQEEESFFAKDDSYDTWISTSLELANTASDLTPLFDYETNS